MITIGLDLSLSSTGMVIKNGETVQLETICTTPKTCENDLLRLRYITDQVVKHIPQDVSLICVEDFFTPMSASQAGSAIKLAMLGTVVRMTLFESKLPFYIISPSQLKKFVTGKGNAQKDMMLMQVFKNYGIECKDDNQADACGLAYLAEALLKPFDGLPKPQMEVLTTIKAERPRYNVAS